MRAALAALLLTAGPLAAAEPPSLAESVRLALGDARDTARASATAAGRTRYLTAYNTPAADLPRMETALKGALPSLSTGTGRTGIRVVKSAGKPVPWLWAFDAGDYGTDLVAWANLGFADPYFHTPSNDRSRVSPIPEHVPQREYQELAALTQSERGTPIFRADYFLFRTSQSVDRLGDGYYDFLALRSVEDVNRLAGFDEARAVRLDADRRAFLQRSGPSPQVRQILRVDAINGPAWKTFDALNSVGPRNVVVNLDRAVSDGGMGVYCLPNRLVFSHLYQVAKGKEELLGVAPAAVAGHRDAITPDLQVHAGSCQHCHLSGMLYPFAGDEARRFYRGSNPFSDRDPARARRVKAVWLVEDLGEALELDQERHDRFMVEASGVGYRKWAVAHKGAVAEYLADVSPAKLAAEMGTTPAALRRTLARFDAREGAGRNNPVVARFAAGDAAVRRDLVEEVFPLLMAEHRQESK